MMRIVAVSAPFAATASAMRLPSSLGAHESSRGQSEPRARFSDVRQFETARAGWNSGWPVCHRQKAYMFAKFRNVTFLSSVKWPLS